MLEDKVLLWKLRNGRGDSLREIYRKYGNDMFRLAIALSSDRNLAEDIVHDAFVSFAQIAGKLKLRMSIKSYLLTCTANRCRSVAQSQSRNRRLECDVAVNSQAESPDDRVEVTETAGLIDRVLGELSNEQREVIVLHLFAGLKFREIAESQNLSINTVQGRYRYGLDRLRSLLEAVGTI
jgi:RNA polymerase sigma factor (sigma-70 family)